MCCEVLTNVLYALSRLALGRASLTGTIVERMYDERSRPVRRPIARPRPEREPTADLGCPAPLALPDLPEEIGRRLIEEHLLDPERFWLPVPPPSVPLTAARSPGGSLRSGSGATGAGRPGSTALGSCGWDWSAWATTEAAAALSRRLGVAVAAARAAGVLRPLHGTRHGCE